MIAARSAKRTWIQRADAISSSSNCCRSVNHNLCSLPWHCFAPIDLCNFGEVQSMGAKGFLVQD